MPQSPVPGYSGMLAGTLVVVAEVAADRVADRAADRAAGMELAAADTAVVAADIAADMAAVVVDIGAAADIVAAVVVDIEVAAEALEAAALAAADMKMCRNSEHKAPESSESPECLLLERCRDHNLVAIRLELKRSLLWVGMTCTPCQIPYPGRSVEG